MSEVDRKELRRLANAATKGKWRIGEWMPKETVGKHQVVVETDIGPYVILEGNQNFIEDANANAAFVAFANPAAILSLLDDLDQYRKDAMRYRWLREQEAEEGIAVLNVTGWERAATCWALTYPDAELLDCAIDTAMAKDHAE